MYTLNNVFHQLSLVIKLLKRKFSKRSDRHDTNHQVEHNCSCKGHQESYFIWRNKASIWNIYCNTSCSMRDTRHGVKAKIHSNTLTERHFLSFGTFDTLMMQTNTNFFLKDSSQEIHDISSPLLLLRHLHWLCIYFRATASDSFFNLFFNSRGNFS